VEPVPHTPLPVAGPELLLWLGVAGLVPLVAAVVLVACYRRCRCLSGYPVGTSLAVAVVAAFFFTYWIVVWRSKKRYTDDEWRRYHQRRALEPAAEPAHA
jgi:hypothetical protein